MKRLKTGLLLLSASLAWGAVAHAAPCPTGANGRWIVKGYHVDDGIVAVSDAETRGMLGKTVTITDRRVVYGDDVCLVGSSTKEHTSSPKGYEEDVRYTCSNKIDLPVFGYGRSCGRLRAFLDGGFLTLVRAR